MDIQKIFSLSEKLIDKNDLNFEEIYYYLPPKFSKDRGNSVLYSAMWTLDAYYENMLKLNLKVGFLHNTLIREIIKNSRWHGGSKDDSPTYIALFIDPEKFIIGDWDGGEYFKRADIKEIWENKGDLKEYHNANQYGIGAHYGYSYFKSKFNNINIDNENGVFYGTFDVNKFIEKFPK